MAKPLLDDALWHLIEPLLPPPPLPGRKPLDNRKVLTGTLFVLKTGLPWEALPQELGCGSGMTCWRRLRDWQQAGVWQQLHEILLTTLHEADQIDWSRAVVDRASVRAVGGGNKRGRRRRIDGSWGVSLISLPRHKAFRWRSSSRKPTGMR